MTDALETDRAIRIRRARPADAAVLTTLVLRSKAAWGYHEGWSTSGTDLWQRFVVRAGLEYASRRTLTSLVTIIF